MLNVRTWKYRRGLGEIALVLVVFFGVRAYQTRNVPSGKAPALEGLMLDGGRVSLDAYRGKPVLVHFWASWCGVCRAAQSNFDAVSRDWPVLSIASHSGDAAQVQAYVQARGIEPAVVVDASSALAKRFGVSASPTSVVLDADGDIRHVEVGYTTEAGLRARLWLASF
jgi:thiol-disulfide isomerase/thioredoxin